MKAKLKSTGEIVDIIPIPSISEYHFYCKQTQTIMDISDFVVEPQKEEYEKMVNIKHEELTYAANMVYMSWMGGTMDDVRYFMRKLGDALGYDDKGVKRS